MPNHLQVVLRPWPYHGDGSKLLWKIKYSSKSLELPNSFRNLLPLPWYYHGHGNSVIYFLHHGSTAVLPADDLADYAWHNILEMKNSVTLYPKLNFFLRILELTVNIAVTIFHSLFFSSARLEVAAKATHYWLFYSRL